MTALVWVEVRTGSRVADEDCERYSCPDCDTQWDGDELVMT